MDVLIKCYGSVEDLPQKIWNDLAPETHLNLNLDHLRAIEKSRINNIRPFYFMGFSNENAIGISYAFMVDTDLSTIGNDIKDNVFAAVKAWQPDFMQTRVLECGVITSVGQGSAVHQEYFEEYIEKLSYEFDRISKEMHADVILFRDIPPADMQMYSRLINRGYLPTLGFAHSILEIKWATFKEYMDALNSERRNNLRRKFRKASGEEIQTRVIDDFGSYAEELAALCSQVAQKAKEYQREELTDLYFKEINDCLSDKSHVVALFLNDQIVAFALCFEGTEDYFAAYFGIDYQYNEDYGLYFNLVAACIKEAIATKKKRLNFGLTAYNFKTQVGCELLPNVYLVKAAKDPELTIGFTTLLKEAIKQPCNDHAPFRGQDISNRKQPADFESSLLQPYQKDDIFSKICQYSRASVAKSSGMYPYFPEFSGPQTPKIERGDREIILLGTNCYLGLSMHPKLKTAAQEAIERFGTGCSGSPFLNGTLSIHNELANSLASFMEKECAILFSTGYQTNLGLISSIAGRGSYIVMDERCHASLVDGARLSFAEVIKYRHNDISHLEEQLIKLKNKRTLIVADSLFSMEGTIANVPEIVKLKNKYNARLMLDESHAIGVLGENGRGVAELYGLINEVDIIMGTFSKAFASQGGFIAGPKRVMEAIRHLARSHIFSASLAPAMVATAQKALEIIKTDKERRSKLLKNAQFLAEGLKSLGYSIEFTGTPIIPLHVGDELLCLALYHKLLDEGVYTNPVINPAVPKGAEMLRISVMATHDQVILQSALSVFERIRTKHFPIDSTANLIELQEAECAF